MTTDVMDFFRASEGCWSSQRNSHHLAMRRSEGGRSEITITCLAPGDPRVVEICHLHKFDPALNIGGALVEWTGTVDFDNDPHDGRAIMVPVPDAPGSPEGSMLRDIGYAELDPVAGRYRMGDDGALTLITTYSETESEERFWFASPNLRLRASVLKRWGGFSMATFSSEIRKSKPTTESANQAKRAWPSEKNAIPDWIQAEAAGKVQELPTESV
jgi:hypothetical protein